MKLPENKKDLLRLYGDKYEFELPTEIKKLFDKYYKMLDLTEFAYDYEQFISTDSIKNLDEKIRLLTALKDGKTFEDLGLEYGKPKFKLLFEDYPAGGEVII